MKVELLYRCGANWKTFFKADVPNTLKIGDEFEMGEHGTLSQNEFFGSDIHPYPFDFNTDHNLLEVVKIINE